MPPAQTRALARAAERWHLDHAPDAREPHWQLGDLAECRHAGPWNAGAIIPNAQGPKHLEVCEVRSVDKGACPYTGAVVQVLTFARWPNRTFPGRAFRRITLADRGYRLWRSRALRALDLARREPHVAGLCAIVVLGCAVAAISLLGRAI